MEAKTKKRNVKKTMGETVHASEKAETDERDEEESVSKKRATGGFDTGEERKEANTTFTESEGRDPADGENRGKSRGKSDSGNGHKSIGQGGGENGEADCGKIDGGNGCERIGQDSRKNSSIEKDDEKRGDVCRSENAGGEESNDRAESGSMASSEGSLGDEISLSKCMLRLLHSPAADCEEADKLKESGFRGEEISQTMLLAQAMLTKAVKNGDVSAYREVEALIDLENDGNGQFERLLNGIREAVRFEQSGGKEKGPD